MENVQDLDMDLVALGLLTPQTRCAATPWTGMQMHPLQDQQQARSEVASQGKLQAKVRPARKKPSAPSRPRKKCGKMDIASAATVQITRRTSEEQQATVENDVNTDNYAVCDVIIAIEEAFDDVLSVEVSGQGDRLKACFRIRFIRSLLMLRMRHILDSNSQSNVVSAEDITEHVFTLLQRFGIDIQ